MSSFFLIIIISLHPRCRSFPLIQSEVPYRLSQRTRFDCSHLSGSLPTHNNSLHVNCDVLAFITCANHYPRPSTRILMPINQVDSLRKSSFHLPSWSSNTTCLVRIFASPWTPTNISPAILPWRRTLENPQHPLALAYRAVTSFYSAAVCSSSSNPSWCSLLASRVASCTTITKNRLLGALSSCSQFLRMTGG